MGFWSSVGNFFKTILVTTGEIVGTFIDSVTKKEFWTSDDYWIKKGQKIGGYYQWGGGSKRDVHYARDKQAYLNRITQINQKYNLNLSEYEIQEGSNRYAKLNDELNYGTDGGFLGTDLKETILKNFDYHIQSEYKKDEAALKQAQLKLEYEKIRNKNSKKLKNEALTQILMKDPFAIFANGALYKKGRPGSKTYDPLTVWEPYKYITGDIKEDEFNDILQNRSHLKLAGNKDYFTHIWDEPQWQTPDKTNIDKRLKKSYISRVKQIQDGLEELAKVGWYSDKKNTQNGIRREEKFIDSDGLQKTKIWYEYPINTIEEMETARLEPIKKTIEKMNHKKHSSYSGFFG